VSKKVPASKKVQKTVKAVIRDTATPRKKSATNPDVVAKARKAYRNSAKTPKTRALPRNLQVPAND